MKSLVSVVTMQMRKVYRRPDVLAFLLISILIPCCVTLLFVGGSDAVSIGKEGLLNTPGIGFFSGLIGLSKVFLLPYFFFALICASIFAGEIKSGIEVFYLVHVSKRLFLIGSKIISAFTLVLATALLFSIFTILCWWFILKGTNGFVDVGFWSGEQSQDLATVLTLCLSLTELFLLPPSFAFLSLLAKNQSRALLFCFFIIVIEKFLENLEEIRNFLPTYIGNGYSLIGLESNDLFTTFISEEILLLFLIIFFTIATLLVYRRIELR
jgi:ABC-type transport system involved in multi-copper enzyme maturation permease subunit